MANTGPYMSSSASSAVCPDNNAEPLQICKLCGEPLDEIDAAWTCFRCRIEDPQVPEDPEVPENPEGPEAPEVQACVTCGEPLDEHFDVWDCFECLGHNTYLDALVRGEHQEDIEQSRKLLERTIHEEEDDEAKVAATFDEMIRANEKMIKEKAGRHPVTDDEKDLSEPAVPRRKRARRAMQDSEEADEQLGPDVGGVEVSAIPAHYKQCPGCGKWLSGSGLATHMTKCCPDLKKPVGNPKGWNENGWQHMEE